MPVDRQTTEPRYRHADFRGRSSALSAARYDAMEQRLVIYFGSLSYEFGGVPSDVYEGLVNASSPGSYYNANIRGVY